MADIATLETQSPNVRGIEKITVREIQLANELGIDLRLGKWMVIQANATLFMEYKQVAQAIHGVSECFLLG